MIKVRDLVVSKNPRGNPLRCGSGTYDCAVVISVKPFVMVSRGTDMRWSSTFTADDVQKIGRASIPLFLKCWWKRRKG